DGAQPPRDVSTTAHNVEEMLVGLGAPLEYTDTVLPSRTASLEAGTRVEGTRVHIAEDRETHAIDPPVGETDDLELPKGQEKVVEPGAPGERVVVIRITTTNGVVTRREELSSQVTKEPQARKLAIGTKQATVPPVADGAVWDRLAQCEAGGNW